MNFSVLMSVYKHEEPVFLKQSLDSVINQTVKPSEIVLVRDGQVSGKLQEVIDDYLSIYGGLFKYISFENNMGLGNALRIGLEECSYDIVARMDTDDICVFDRFEKQIKAFQENPEVDLIGGQVVEFEKDIDGIVGERKVPLTNKEIARYLKKRSPFNHPTVMYKKSSVLNAGNYLEMHFVEDYFLWCRMYLNGCRFINLPDDLVYMRVSYAMYERRGGYSYFKMLKTLDKFKRDNKIINRHQYCKNVCIRFAQCVLLPNKVRGLIYRRVLHKKRTRICESQ